jgi:hypothetical protein
MKLKNILFGCIAMAGLAGAASPAQAAVWDLTIDWSSSANHVSSGPVTEIATINSTGGVVFGGVYVGYELLGDNLGNHVILFGASITNGFVGTAPAIHHEPPYGDHASPALYTGGSSANIAPGHTYTLEYGSTLTVTSAAAPEASTWAMMLLGFAGLAFVGYRQKQGLRTQAADCGA